MEKLSEEKLKTIQGVPAGYSLKRVFFIFFFFMRTIQIGRPKTYRSI